MTIASSIRAGSAYIELSVHTNKLTAGLKAAQAKIQAVGRAMGSIGKQMAMASAAVVAPVSLATREFVKLGDGLNKMSIRTGASVAALSELRYAAQQSGASLVSVERGIKGMQQVLQRASRGLSRSTWALEQLGLNYDELAAMSPEDQFTVLADALSQVEDETKRAGLAMTVFGRAGSELMPLLSGGAEGIGELRSRARELGITLSDVDAQSAADLADAWNDVKQTLYAAVIRIGASVAPMLTEWAARVSAVTARIGPLIDRFKQIGPLVLRGAVAVGALGVGLMATGAIALSLSSIFGVAAGAITGLGAAVGAAGSILAALASPAGLAVAAVAGFGVAVVYYTGAAGSAWQWLGDRFAAIGRFFRETWGAIVNAVRAGDFEAAMEVVWASLRVGWLGVQSWLTGMWTSVKEAWLDLSTDIQTIWAALMASIKRLWLTAQEPVAHGIAWIIAKVKGLDPAEVAKTLEEDYARRMQGVEANLSVRLGDIRDSAAAKRDAYDDQRSAAEAALDAARDAWRDTVTDAAELTAPEMETMKKPDRPDMPDIASAGVAVEQKLSTVGTFSGFAAQTMGFGSETQRIASATERTANEVAEMNRRQFRGGGFEFA